MRRLISWCDAARESRRPPEHDVCVEARRPGPRLPTSLTVRLAPGLVIGALAWGTSVDAQSPRAATATRNTTASTGATAPPGDSAGTWVTPGKDYASTRYSPLDQITTANVSGLKEVWSYTTGIQDGHEGQPLVVNGTMYIVTPFPNKVIAFDLSKPGPGVS